MEIERDIGCRIGVDNIFMKSQKNMDRRSFIHRLVGFATAFGASPSCFPSSKFNVMPRRRTHVKAIGVGGAGVIAVDLMIRSGINGIEFACIDTDVRILNGSAAATKIQLPPGFGNGIESAQKARDMASLARKQLTELVRDADMIFIIAGMGGSIGTRVATNVAEVARELGILTVALVTKPLKSEGQRLELSKNGIKELAKHANAMIVIDNAEIMEGLADWGEPVIEADAFETSDGCLSRWVSSIADMINVPDLVTADFADLRTVLVESGITRWGSTGPICSLDHDGTYNSVLSARYSAEDAIYGVETEGFKLSEARSILVIVTGDASLGIDEVNEVASYVRTRASPNTRIVVGAIRREGMMEFVQVRVIAKGFVDPSDTLVLNGKTAPDQK